MHARERERDNPLMNVLDVFAQTEAAAAVAAVYVFVCLRAIGRKR